MLAAAPHRHLACSRWAHSLATELGTPGLHIDSMTRLRTALTLALLTLAPALASAQGGRGGWGGGGGGRSRGERGEGDTTVSGKPRTPLSFAEIVYAHRTDLQLTDSQTVKVTGIRMTALAKRAMLNNQLDSVRANLAETSPMSAAPPTDSSRKAILDGRRAMSAVLGQLHDVDVDARNETLLVLTPAQQKKAEQLEEVANAPPAASSGSDNGGRRGGGGGRRGGMGGGMGGGIGNGVQAP